MYLYSLKCINFIVITGENNTSSPDIRRFVQITIEGIYCSTILNRKYNNICKVFRF